MSMLLILPTLFILPMLLTILPRPGLTPLPVRPSRLPTTRPVVSYVTGRGDIYCTRTHLTIDIAPGPYHKFNSCT